MGVTRTFFTAGDELHSIVGVCMRTEADPNKLGLQILATMLPVLRNGGGALGVRQPLEIG